MTDCMPKKYIKKLKTYQQKIQKKIQKEIPQDKDTVITSIYHQTFLNYTLRFKGNYQDKRKPKTW